MLEQSGISFGAVLPPFSHVPGWLFIRICRVLRRGRRRIVFKGGYGTHVFWWNKPLNVNRPVRVFRKSGDETQPQSSSEGREPARRAVGKGFGTILVFIIGGQDKDVNLSREDRVPRFWANSTTGNAGIAEIMLGVGICFGAIHCIAWGFPFPTHTELLIWRVSSVTITAVPVFIPLMFGLGLWLQNMNFDTIGGIFGISAVILYIIARVVTLVLALTSLRDLPPGAFDTVHWTTFIPHI